MGPQEHAFRSGVDVIVAHAGPPARSFPARRTRSSTGSSTSCSTKPTACSTWASCRHPPRPAPPARRSGRRCSSARRCRRRSRSCRARCCSNPATINLERQSAPAVGITQAVYPVPQDLKAALLRAAAASAARCATRSSSRARSTAPNRLAEYLARARHQRRAHSRQPLAGAAHRGARRLQERAATGCSSPPTSRRAASTSTALGHVVNFDVPAVARGLHPPRRPHGARRADRRRRSRSSSPEEEGDLRDIERAIGKRLPRVTVPDFDYTARHAPPLEVPHRAAHRGDPRAESAGARAREDQRGAPGGRAIADVSRRRRRPRRRRRASRCAVSGGTHGSGGAAEVAARDEPSEHYTRVRVAWQPSTNVRLDRLRRRRCLGRSFRGTVFMSFCATRSIP